MNSDVLLFLLSIIAGMALGLSYFGGLGLTIRRLPTTGHPMLLAIGSFLLRLGVSLIGFYLVMGAHWERLLVCLLGFLVM